MTPVQLGGKEKTNRLAEGVGGAVLFSCALDLNR